MEIIYEDYLIKQSDAHYDITKNTGRKDKKGEDIVEVIGYGYTFENALKRIIKEELSNKDVKVTIKEYIELFKEELIKLKNYTENT